MTTALTRMFSGWDLYDTALAQQNLTSGKIQDLGDLQYSRDRDLSDVFPRVYAAAGVWVACRFACTRFLLHRKNPIDHG